MKSALAPMNETRMSATLSGMQVRSRLLYDRTVIRFATALLASLLITLPYSVFGGDASASRLLLTNKTQDDLQLFLPRDTRLLRDSVTIERFLEELDGAPPDWPEIHGHHEQPNDESLFALNRERDRLRAGRPALSQRITFLWDGMLSSYVPDQCGFLVAVGPEMIDTKWGMVRFKPESLPAELIAVPAPLFGKFLQTKLAHGENVRLIVAMTGHVVPEESLIYDFAHEDRHQGMIMPMVRVEQIDYFFPLP
jgi:hypothetical protein